MSIGKAIEYYYGKMGEVTKTTELSLYLTKRLLPM